MAEQTAWGYGSSWDGQGTALKAAQQCPMPAPSTVSPTVKATLQCKVQLHLLRCCQPLILQDALRLSFPLHPYNTVSTGKKLPR